MAATPSAFMPDIHYPLLLLIVGLNVLVYGLCWQRLHAGTERFFLALLLGGLCLYSGVGAAIVPVSWDYVAYYCCFTLMTAASFLGAITIARRFARGQAGLYERLERLVRNRVFWPLALVAYIATSVVPLLYPEFQLAKVWHPPMPDLATVLNEGIAFDQPLLLRLNGYAGWLSWPFYLLALFSLRRRYVSLAICIVAPLYLQYCSSGYVGRGEMGMCLALYIGVLWLDRPVFRLRIAILTAVCLPLMLVFFGIYSRIRLPAASVEGISPLEQVQEVLLVETSLPRSWNTLVDSRRRVDLGTYTKWLFTLPIPKALTGEITRFRINHEISGIVSGIYTGESDFTIVLTGPVIESVYIYGTFWFWIHAAFIGALGGLLCAFAGGCRAFLVVLVHFALLFGYIYNRAGISGTMPPVLNSYLSLYVTVFVLWSLGTRSTSSGRTPLNSGCHVALAGN